MQIAIHTPPPGSTADDDRDAACGEMIDPALDTLMSEAVAVGWHPGEIIAAVLDWVTLTTIDQAGREAALDLLAQAQRMIEEK